MRYKYDSECINAEIEIEVDTEDTYATIDDGIVYVTPSYRFYRDNKEVKYPLTEGVFKRSGECTSLRSHACFCPSLEGISCSCNEHRHCITSECVPQFQAVLTRRLRRKPLAYL